jgi:hypothetical protein
VEKFQKMGLILKKKKCEKYRVLCEEKLDDSIHLEASPRKSLHMLALHRGVSKASACMATKR